MSTDTRAKILNTARHLFNERGINGVSISDIAHEVGISKGNVTYHFAKKEKIVEALLFDTEQTATFTPTETVSDLVGMIEHMQNVVTENAYYFRHYAQIAQMIPRVAQQQKRVYALYRAAMLQSLQTLQEQGLISEVKTQEDMARVVDAIFITCVFWLPFSELKGKPSESGLQQCMFYLNTLFEVDLDSRLE